MFSPGQGGACVGRTSVTATERRSTVPSARSTDALVDVARRYYLQQQSQQEIARDIGSTRSNVSRMLSAARERGIVRIDIRRPPDRDEETEALLRSRLGLREVLVAAPEDTGLAAVARLAADWLVDHLSDGMRLGVSWGRTLGALVRSIRPNRRIDMEAVQLGGSLEMMPQYSGHEIVRGIAERFEGSYAYLHAPAIVDSSEAVRALRRTRAIERQLARAAESDVALLGIGGFGAGFAAQLLESGHLDAKERCAFEQAGVVGDVLARFYDASGEQQVTPLRDRVLALELDELREIPRRVGVAEGLEKVPGVLGAARGGIIDTLVTDRATACAVLDLDLHRMAPTKVVA